MSHASPAAQLVEPAILHQTPHWLVLNKPARWHSVAKGRKVRREEIGRPAEPDVETWLRSRFDWTRDLPEAGLVHRLDFDTSGCLMVSKSGPGIEQWRAAFQSGDSIGKVYLALARSGLAASGRFDLFFTSRHTRSKMITVMDQGELKHRGQCTWRVLQSSGDHDLVEVQIIGPGRRHQIRAGLAHLGHPLAGDELYSGPSTGYGLALHAWKLVIDGQSVVAPPPAWGAAAG